MDSVREGLPKEPARNLAVSCNGIVKAFGEGQTRVTVLRGVNFEAKAGEMTFLVGPSGCGKTTLISIIGGLLTSEAGDLNVLGVNLKSLSRGKLADFRLSNLGFIFQQFNLLPALTAAENAAVPMIASGVRGRDAAARSKEMLERLGLKGQTHKFPDQLSGGQQQRVAIARALLHEPKLIICDEPTASLDAATGHVVMELLREVALQEGRSVIIVTHDNRIYDFADHIAHMSDGVISRIDRDSSELVNIAPTDHH